jgi:protoheme IX farnesyltransferase
MESLADRVIDQADEKPLSPGGRLAAYFELTKPRITFLVTLTSAAGYCLAAREIDLIGLLTVSLGVALLCSGISTLNQYIERDLDARMQRTRLRPLPSGKLAARQALAFGMMLSAIATAYLAIAVNALTALLGVLTFASYLLVYTPLKTRTTLSTAIGALPGAMPPLLGWAAARGQLGLEAWALFAILFLWQFPHFLAIAWMYRDDYARAGIRMLPVVEPQGRVTAQQIVVYTVMLVPVSLLPVKLNLAGEVYLAGALVLGAAFLYFSARAALSKKLAEARLLLLASVLYLPALFALMVINKT